MKRMTTLFLLTVLIAMTSCTSKLARQAPAKEEAGWAQVAHILQNIQEPVFPNRDYNILDFGAVGDGVTDCRPAFIEAIDRCNRDGGGRIVVPRGDYFVKGPLHLKSNVNLFLDKRSTIIFSENPDDYLPVVLTKWEGTELYNYSPLIYAYQATNVAVTGSGTIDGNATNGFATWKPKQKEAQKRLRQMGADGVPVNERIFGKGHWLRPSMIQFFGCKNVLVEGVTILDSPFWVIHPSFCYNVTVRNVTVSSWNKNNDGCDPDASVNVLIENCVFNTGDDGIAIKSGRDQDGWRVGQATENVVVRGCRINSTANGLCIGSEMSGGVRNVFMEDCTVDSAVSTVYFKSNLDRGGMIENVWVRNVKVDRAKGAFIRFETNYKGHRGNMFPPIFRNFHLENITCREANVGVFAEGHESANLQNITLKDIFIKNAKTPFYIRLAKNFFMDNVVINGDRQPFEPPLADVKQKLDMGW